MFEKTAEATEQKKKGNSIIQSWFSERKMKEKPCFFFYRMSFIYFRLLSQPGIIKYSLIYCHKNQQYLQKKTILQRYCTYLRKGLHIKGGDPSKTGNAEYWR